MEYVYHCKKNGRDYIYFTAVEFALPQDAYAWRRGVREYADNYHASVTRKDWQGTDEQFADEIDVHCNEALQRFNAGDVPAERGAADPKTTQARKQAARILAASPEIQAQIDALLSQSVPTPPTPVETKKKKAA